MGFTIEVGEEIVPTAGTWETGNDSAHYTYFVCVSNPCGIGVALTDISALVLLEVTNAKYKFATFSVSGASWVLESIETSWHTSTSTVKQVVSVSSGSLACAAGDYIGIVFEVPANTDLNDGIGYADLSGDLLNDLNTSYITSGTGTSASWRTYIYGYGEYNHNNTSTIPQTSQSTGALSIDELYTGYGAIRLTDIDCVGTYSALFEMQSPWGETDNTVVLESGQSETMSRSITGGTEYYKVTVTNINCVSNTVTFTEQWWSDDGNRYVKTTGSDSAMGTTWGVAWRTAGYGFQNIPSGKDLYVEEGLYGGETLSNLNPPQTMKMYIQPTGHTEAACEVLLSDTAIINGGYTCTTRPNTGSLPTNKTSVLQNTISANGTIHRFCIYTLNAVQIKFKVFRSDGTNYNVVHTSPSWISKPGGKKTYNVNWAVQAGDFIGFSNIESGYRIYMESAAGAFKYFAGDVTTSVVISSGYDLNYAVSLYAMGFA